MDLAHPKISDAPLAPGRPGGDELDLAALGIPPKSSQRHESY
jgi:hypothetical protein